jgi:5-methyltetrahydrofolate--homocysteine methyltransferase
LNELSKAIADLKEADAIALCEQLVGSGEEPGEILTASGEAMSVVGHRFEKGEYYLPDLIMAEEIMKEISSMVLPLMHQADDEGHQNTVVLGTVKSDIHDIGKDIVAFMLDANGFRVKDLGVDVPPPAFVEALRETDASILALSGLLATALEPMKQTVEAVQSAKLRTGVKVMVGGGPVDERARGYVGADDWGATALDAVRLAKVWSDERED